MFNNKLKSHKQGTFNNETRLGSNYIIFTSQIKRLQRVIIRQDKRNGAREPVYQISHLEHFYFLKCLLSFSTFKIHKPSVTIYLLLCVCECNMVKTKLLWFQFLKRTFKWSKHNVYGIAHSTFFSPKRYRIYGFYLVTINQSALNVKRKALSCC